MLFSVNYLSQDDMQDVGNECSPATEIFWIIRTYRFSEARVIDLNDVQVTVTKVERKMRSVYVARVISSSIASDHNIPRTDVDLVSIT